MPEFGDALRDLRMRYKLRQTDLVESFGGGLSRSVIANVEAGRQPPSALLWALVVEHFPGEAERLRPAYERARAGVDQAAISRRRDRREISNPTNAVTSADLLGGPYLIERYEIVYVFRESRSPEEVLELRQVRALKKARGYGMMFTETEDPDFQEMPEVLWGGNLVHEERRVGHGSTVYLRRLDFGRELRRGDVHRFGLRYWVERAPKPSTYVDITMTRQAEVVGLHLNFWGGKRPAICWRHGPFPDESMVPGAPTPDNTLIPSSGNCVSTEFKNPEIGVHFGLAWQW